SMYIVSKGVVDQATYINHHDDAATDSTNNTIGSFVGWAQIPGGGTTTQAHGVASIGNTIYVFRRTSTGGIEWNFPHDGTPFAAAWTALAGPNAPTTNVGPSAAVIRDRIYVFAVGTNGALYVNSGKAAPPIAGTWADAPAPTGFTFPYGVHSSLLYN